MAQKDEGTGPRPHRCNVRQRPTADPKHPLPHAKKNSQIKYLNFSSNNPPITQDLPPVAFNNRNLKQKVNNH